MKRKISLILLLISPFFWSQISNNNTQLQLDSLKNEVGFLKESIIKLDQSKTTKSNNWYDKFSIGGYIQMRYNELFESNPNLECEQCDHFWGNDGSGFSFRRVRFKLAGQITPRIYFYLQPDFAKTVGSSQHVGILKDAYFDVGLDRDNVYKIRMGQSKVPYGFENLQSSSDRLPLDRNDAMNSGLKDERDLGVFFMWASKDKKKLMEKLYKENLKHSGDFGVFAFGIYNGQTGNNADKNKKFHVVTRFTYPMQFGNQIIEPGIQAYTGKFVLPNVSKNVGVNQNLEYLDQRLALSFILYPRPFGIQAEYNIGKGPEFNKNTNSIEVQNLNGGYATFSYYLKKGEQLIIPYARIQHYNGGKKHELDARSYKVREMEAGIEWHPFKAFELVAAFVNSERSNGDFINNYNFQKGNLIRLQAQLKF